jgi:hypothetical protein
VTPDPEEATQLEGVGMDSEDRFWVCFWVICAVVFLAAIAFAFYDSQILPQRMADKGYCQQLVSVPNQAAVVLWQPCKAQTPEAK